MRFAAVRFAEEAQPDSSRGLRVVDVEEEAEGLTIVFLHTI